MGLFDTRNKKIAWGALGVLVLILLILPDPKKIGIEAPVVETPSPVVKTETVREEKPAYVIDAEYPQLEGLGEEERQAIVNDMIKKEVLDSVAEFKKNQSDLFAEGQQSDFQIRYDVAYLNASLFSLDLQYFESYSGAAHPYGYSETMNFDLRSGERVRLDDLFLSDAEYLPVLAEAPKKELEARFPTEEGQKMWDEDGAKPTAANYEEFLITPEGFVVIFNPYQVVAYAAGVQRITVPYAALAELLDPAGILAAR